MRQALLALVCVGACAWTAASAATAPTGAQACKTVFKKIDGVNSEVYCGPATATVKLDGKTIRYTKGSCAKLAGDWEVGIGIEGPVRYPVFHLLLQGTTKPGTYTGAGRVALAFTYAGKRYSVLPVTLVVKPALSGGTFTGKASFSTPVTGSFSCR